MHMWTQVVGKIRLRLTPLVNHWWNVPLYVTARGLTTSGIPYRDRSFELRFDFIQHQLVLETSDAIVKKLPLQPRPVADFYEECLAMLRSAGIDVKIWPMPVEIPNPIRFDQDRQHSSYDPESVVKFWRILLSVDAVFQQFRSQFIGKSSPVHFFWGSFDLAVTRFSGRKAPPREGADPSLARPIRTKSAVSDSGLARAFRGRHSTHTWRRSLRGFARPRRSRRPLAMTRRSANSSLCTTTSAQPHPPPMRCSPSAKVPTKPAQGRQTGIATASNGVNRNSDPLEPSQGE